MRSLGIQLPFAESSAIPALINHEELTGVQKNLEYWRWNRERRDATCHEICGRAGAAPMLIKCAADGRHRQVCNATKCLSILADVGEECSATIVTAGAVPVLVRLLSSDFPNQQCRAAEALARLARDCTWRSAAIASAGAVPPLVRLAAI